jgi:hypothetical protein
MTVQQIAERLAELCKKGQWEIAQKELYADDIISIEPYAMPGFDKETTGLSAIIEKGHRFQSMVDEMHSLSISEPLIAGNTIAFVMHMDLTMKGRAREESSELCVYQVKDGKIISEQFFV